MAQTNADELPDSVLVLVNGEPITTEDLDREFMKVHRRMESDMMVGFDYDRLVEKLVNDMLIIQEASAMGMAEEGWLVNYLEEQRTKKAIREYLRDSFDREVEITEPMMKRYFDSLYHRKQYRTLTLRTEEEANKYRDMILAGADMDSLAKELSLDSYKFKGGLQNFKHWADIPVLFREVLIDMEVDELSAPFPFREAFTIVRLERAQEADPAEYPIFENTIRGRMESEAREQKWNNFVDSLSQLVTIERNDSVLTAIENDGDHLFTEDFTNYSPIPVLTAASGVEVSEGQLRKEISHNAMSSATTPYPVLFSQHIDQAEQKVVLGEMAMRAGYGDSSVVMDAINRSLDSALIETYIQEQIVPQITFTHEGFQNYYDEHAEEFRAAEQFQFYQAFLASEEEANEFIERLNEGADFMFLKRQYGSTEMADDKSQEWVTMKTFPDDVQKELKGLSIGEASKPYPTSSGWVVFELKDRRPGRLRTMDEVNMEIRQGLFQQKFNTLLDEHLGILKEHSEIVYNRDAIDEYFRRETEN